MSASSPGNGISPDRAFSCSCNGLPYEDFYADDVHTVAVHVRAPFFPKGSAVRIALRRIIRQGTGHGFAGQCQTPFQHLLSTTTHHARPDRAPHWLRPAGPYR